MICPNCARLEAEAGALREALLLTVGWQLPDSVTDARKRALALDVLREAARPRKGKR